MVGGHGVTAPGDEGTLGGGYPGDTGGNVNED